MAKLSISGKKKTNRKPNTVMKGRVRVTARHPKLDETATRLGFHSVEYPGNSVILEHRARPSQRKKFERAVAGLKKDIGEEVEILGHPRLI